MAIFDNDPAEVWTCVDPGLTGTGWAVFHKADFEPVSWGVIVAKGNSKEWVERVRGIGAQFKQVIQNAKAAHVILEWQELFRSGVSMASATKGDLFKLSVLTGALTAISWEYTGRTPELKKPMEWKGQLPKEIVEKRVIQHYQNRGLPAPAIPNHAMDAVGMGFARRGLL